MFNLVKRIPRSNILRTYSEFAGNVVYRVKYKQGTARCRRLRYKYTISIRYADLG